MYKYIFHFHFKCEAHIRLYSLHSIQVKPLAWLSKPWACILLIWAIPVHTHVYTWPFGLCACFFYSLFLSLAFSSLFQACEWLWAPKSSLIDLISLEQLITLFINFSFSLNMYNISMCIIQKTENTKKLHFKAKW